jgi:hypothetical protein
MPFTQKLLKPNPNLVFSRKAVVYPMISMTRPFRIFFLSLLCVFMFLWLRVPDFEGPAREH